MSNLNKEQIAKLQSEAFDLGENKVYSYIWESKKENIILKNMVKYYKSVNDKREKSEQKQMFDEFLDRINALIVKSNNLNDDKLKTVKELDYWHGVAETREIDIKKLELDIKRWSEERF